MPRHRTPLEVAAGKLTSAIQREWHDESGTPSSDASEQVMYSSHTLLQAAKTGSVVDVLGARSISDFLGSKWVQAHPRVLPYIRALEALGLGDSAT